MKKIAVLLTLGGMGVFVCLCMCAGIAAIAGEDSGNDWGDEWYEGSNEVAPEVGEAPEAPEIAQAPEGLERPNRLDYYNYDYDYDSNSHHNGWFWFSGFATFMLVSIVVGVVGMAFYSSRKLTNLPPRKRQSII
jgi:hypothetical protein